MPRPRVTSQMTTAQVAKELGMKKGRVVSWIEDGALSPLNFTDNNGVRYFGLEQLVASPRINILAPLAGL